MQVRVQRGTEPKVILDSLVLLEQAVNNNDSAAQAQKQEVWDVLFVVLSVMDSMTADANIKARISDLQKRVAALKG